MLHAVKATAVVSARGRARSMAGHPWIFRDDVVRGPERDAGDGGPFLVDVTDGRGRSLGRATWAKGARIGLRMLGHIGGDGGDAGDGLEALLALCERRLDAARVSTQHTSSERNSGRRDGAADDVGSDERGPRRAGGPGGGPPERAAGPGARRRQRP